MCADAEWYYLACIECQQKAIKLDLMHEDLLQDKQVFYSYTFDNPKSLSVSQLNQSRVKLVSAIYLQRLGSVESL